MTKKKTAKEIIETEEKQTARIRLHTSICLTSETLAIIEALQTRLGLSRSGVIQQALRKLALVEFNHEEEK